MERQFTVVLEKGGGCGSRVVKSRTYGPFDRVEYRPNGQVIGTTGEGFNAQSEFITQGPGDNSPYDLYDEEGRAWGRAVIGEHAGK